MICNFMIFSESVGSGARLSAELIVQQADNSHKLLNLWEFFYPLVSALK